MMTSARIQKMLKINKRQLEAGLYNLETYAHFQHTAEAIKDDLLSFLLKLKVTQNR